MTRIRSLLKQFFLLLTAAASAATPAFCKYIPPSLSPDPLVKALDLDARNYPDEAAVQLHRCKSLSSASPQQLFLVARTYLRAGESKNCIAVVDQALSQKSVKQDRTLCGTLYDLQGQAYGDIGQVDKAVSAFKASSRICPDMSIYTLPKAGEFLMKEKRYEEALPLLTSGVQKGKMNGFIYQNIGNCYLRLHQPQKAIKPLTCSVADFDEFRKNETEAFLPGLCKSLQLLIKAHEETGDKKTAIALQKRLDTTITALNQDFFGNR